MTQHARTYLAWLKQIEEYICSSVSVYGMKYIKNGTRGVQIANLQSEVREREQEQEDSGVHVHSYYWSDTM